jgi:hypothetical protein
MRSSQSLDFLINDVTEMAFKISISQEGCWLDGIEALFFSISISFKKKETTNNAIVFSLLLGCTSQLN